MTRRLLEHWHDSEARQFPFYFCQLEAIETLIWQVEAAVEFRQGIFVSGDGGDWGRSCSKMATGAGKTTVMAIDMVIRPVLAVDWHKIPVLTLDPALTPISAELAPAVGGATDMSKAKTIDLERLPEEFHLQRLVFRSAQKAFDELKGRFTGNREYLIFQLVRLVEEFLDSDRLDIPSRYHREPLRRRILIALNLDIIVQHLTQFITEQNQERLEPVCDEDMPIGSTGGMRTWYTTKQCMPTTRSQISHAVADSSWEQYTAEILESRKNGLVAAYAKNDHLGSASTTSGTAPSADSCRTI